MSCGRLPPTGDRGQRYEIRFDDEDGERVMGWSETYPTEYLKAVKLHPSWRNGRVIDRELARLRAKALRRTAASAMGGYLLKVTEAASAWADGYGAFLAGCLRASNPCKGKLEPDWFRGFDDGVRVGATVR